MGGETERVVRLLDRALGLLAQRPDLPRAAWFWTQRGPAVHGQTRGDGRRALARAQEALDGLHPSRLHARVLALAAGWVMLCEPGPEAIVEAERAAHPRRPEGGRGRRRGWCAEDGRTR
ncbi:hypothetical protein [Streptomyces sp. HSG2]|uniref:hypothetical protein n=1 Tax=Streptomyces sp. HSG2 TaxID=2797167 RepID=UPI001907C83F|nr:hypothetical protein [Streptomyces sp. HSG2]